MASDGMAPDRMTIASMTGFARSGGQSGPWRWTWELKAVNGRGLDLKFRLPPSFESIAEDARKIIGAALSRGSVFVSLTAQRESAAPSVRINEAALTALVEAAQRVSAARSLREPAIEALFAVKGVVEVIEADDSTADLTQTGRDLLAGLEQAVAALQLARREEGARLAAILHDRIDRIAAGVDAVDASPARTADAIRLRLQAQVEALMTGPHGLDPQRLHQEAAILASRADVREEIDRLRAHVDAARDLLATPEPVGRRLDFLAQEFGREVNTLCAKVNDAALTRIGLELKTIVEQFREQVQNVE